jgi:23S rRNA (adenine-N6)-dimethyltransferase
VFERRARGARRPGRAHSQHFLRSQSLAAELVGDAGIRPGDLAVDLGAGSGRLTRELAAVAGRVLAVELDPRWAAQLRGRWPNVEVVEADAASCRLPRSEFRVVANLPFEGTNPILRHLLDDPAVPLVRADLVVQWGVAVKRALPWPSTVNGVVWRAWYTISAERRLPPVAFDPPPSVEAGVLVVRRRDRPLVAPTAAHGYRRFVASGFRHGLRGVASGRTLGRLGLSRRQPRELDAHEWARLFARCK